ncbi:hypothetical protein L484_008737 [Morus notabilis]|uniref:Uncharacterized protein n=1 Tax=Morus notabilis TaxID=981085 RepID=W9QYL0_9ROSA|nr:hypothetical protein L484_008737 [Morus notabilis]
MQIDVSKPIKNATVKMLDAFVDSAFEFVNLNHSSRLRATLHRLIDKLGEPLIVPSVEENIPDNFPEGVYIRNGQ